MTCDEQLVAWLEGSSVHNPTVNECTPDFSCCRPKLQWDRERRQYYVDHPDERYLMEIQALGALLKHENFNATVIGG